MRHRDSQQFGIGVDRRRFLEVGSVASWGLTWPKLLGAENSSTTGRAARTARADSVVVIFLWGGPSQQDLWDLKPNAASAIRGEFLPIATQVPGIQISDQLPNLSRQTDKFTIIRSMSHRDFEHGSAAYTALTGQPHPKPGTNTPASPDDFPTYGSIVTKLAPSRQPVPDAMVMGPVMHQGNRPPLAGQNAGFLGPGFEAFRIVDDPNSQQFGVDDVGLAEGLSKDRFKQRQKLINTLDQSRAWRSDHRLVQGMQDLYQRAFSLLDSPKTKQALDLTRESTAVRDRYGRTRFGQTMLMVRRLVQARVPLVTINWAKKNTDQWDTHANNYPRLRKLLPAFDRGLAEFLADLDRRGLLETTLVVCLGEFGRTAKINKDAGRDHWPDCYSVVVAGGGIAAGRVFGSSNAQASYPTSQGVSPWDLAATVYHQLGIDPKTHITNAQGQPFLISQGEVISGLF